MIEIIFQKRQDAVNLYRQLIGRLGACCEYGTILLTEDRNKVCIPEDLLKKEGLTAIKDCFFAFITTTKRDDWFRSILRNSFLYTEEEEQDQIIDIIYSVLDGNREELLPFMEGLKVNGQIRALIDEIFNERISFSFDSFVMFRLKSYLDLLSNWMEVAIDEYKMEQEYQVFIQTLREFLAGRKPRAAKLHLLIDENPLFFDSRFIELKRSDLFRAIDRKLLVNHPVYVDSFTIAPMLSIAPEMIYLYADDFQQPLVRTILNIFEERVHARPLASFYLEQRSYFDQDSKNVQ